MKILQLSKKFPYPLNDGESLAVQALMQPLKQLGVEISLLVMSTPKHAARPETMPLALQYYKAVYSVPVDTDLKPIAAFFNLFTNKSYNISRFYNTNFAKELIGLLKQENFDLVQLETLYLAPYIDLIRANSNAKIVLRSHNVEYEIWKRMATNEHFFLKKCYLSLLYRRLRNFEIEKIKDYDLLVSITERDRLAYLNLGAKCPSMSAPMGIDLEKLPKLTAKTPNAEALRLGFIGSLDWMPNIEGVEWFLDKVWPLVQAKFPKFEFHIAGRNMPETWKNRKDSNVFFHGMVPDATDFVLAQDIIVVPLLSGGGMKIKTIEAMSLAKPLVSTTIGVEGIVGNEEQHVFLLANTPEVFFEKISFLGQNPNKLAILGNAAQQLVCGNFDRNAIAKKVLEAYEALLIKDR